MWKHYQTNHLLIDSSNDQNTAQSLQLYLNKPELTQLSVDFLIFLPDLREEKFGFRAEEDFWDNLFFWIECTRISMDLSFQSFYIRLEVRKWKDFKPMRCALRQILMDFVRSSHSYRWRYVQSIFLSFQPNRPLVIAIL